MGRPKTIQDSALLEVARKIFRERGHTATTRDVAQAAGISEAIIYQRFKTKDELFYAALAPRTDSLSGLLDIDMAAHTPKSYLALFCARTKDQFRAGMPSVLSLAAHPTYGKEMMGEVHRHNRVGEIFPILQLRLKGWQEAGIIRPVNLRAFMTLVVHALHSMAMVEVISGNAKEPTKPEELHDFVDVIWDHLKPDHAAPKPKKAKKPRAKSAPDSAAQLRPARVRRD